MDEGMAVNEKTDQYQPSFTYSVESTIVRVLIVLKIPIKDAVLKTEDIGIAGRLRSLSVFTISVQISMFHCSSG